jgi:hypothetical protein
MSDHQSTTCARDCAHHQADGPDHGPDEAPAGNRAERRARRYRRPGRIVRPGFEGTPVERIRQARLALLRASGAGTQHGRGEADTLGPSGIDPRRPR